MPSYLMHTCMVWGEKTYPCLYQGYLHENERNRLTRKLNLARLLHFPSRYRLHEVTVSSKKKCNKRFYSNMFFGVEEI